MQRSCASSSSGPATTPGRPSPTSRRVWPPLERSHVLGPHREDRQDAAAAGPQPAVGVGVAVGLEDEPERLARAVGRVAAAVGGEIEVERHGAGEILGVGEPAGAADLALVGPAEPREPAEAAGGVGLGCRRRAVVGALDGHDLAGLDQEDEASPVRHRDRAVAEPLAGRVPRCRRGDHHGFGPRPARCPEEPGRGQQPQAGEPHAPASHAQASPRCGVSGSRPRAVERKARTVW